MGIRAVVLGVYQCVHAVPLVHILSLAQTSHHTTVGIQGKKSNTVREGRSRELNLMALRGPCSNDFGHIIHLKWRKSTD